MALAATTQLFTCKYCGAAGNLRKIPFRGLLCDDANACAARQTALGKILWQELPALDADGIAERAAQARFLTWLLEPENQWHVCFIAEADGRTYYQRVTGPDAASFILARYRFEQDYERATGRPPR